MKGERCIQMENIERADNQGIVRAGQLITASEAKPRKKQHKYPCTDCPFARKSVQGWLGRITPENWLRIIHGDGIVECHTVSNQQCAGAAIFRANVCKDPRDKEALSLPQNKISVFANDQEFLNHHTDWRKNGRRIHKRAR